MKKNIEPIFKDNYGKFSKNEFLLDSYVEFSKLKKLLQKEPHVLEEDPIIGIEYLKIMDLIERKKLLERTEAEYDPKFTR